MVMLKSWRQLKFRQRLVFLLLFAVLLPTVALLVTQYYSLLDLRGKTRLAYENSLRQTIQQIDGNLEARISRVNRWFKFALIFRPSIYKSRERWLC